MKKIILLNEKGGQSKTTMAATLGTELAGRVLALVVHLTSGTRYHAVAAWEDNGVNVCIEWQDGDMTTSGILWIPCPAIDRLAEQVRDALVAFIWRMESPVYQQRSTEPL